MFQLGAPSFVHFRLQWFAQIISWSDWWTTLAQSVKLYWAIFWDPESICELLYLHSCIQFSGIFVSNVIYRKLLVDVEFLHLLLRDVEYFSLYRIEAFCHVCLSTMQHIRSYHLVDHFWHLMYVSISPFESFQLHFRIILEAVGLFHCIELPLSL